jgi:hypothetical protein
MAAIVETAEKVGYRELYLETGPLQPAARALYEGLGWTKVDRYPEGAHVHDTGTRFHATLSRSDAPAG